MKGETQHAATEHVADSRAVTVAACVACVMVLTHTLIHRELAVRLATPRAVKSLDTSALDEFPTMIGEWEGEQVPMDPMIHRMTGAEGSINRRYTRNSGFESVLFYLACGARARDLMPHRPEVCYVGNGWTLVRRHFFELPMDKQRNVTLPCSVLQFSRGVFNTERIVVLHYYIVDGEYCRDVSLLRSRAWRGSNTVQYVVQVQVVAPITETSTVESAMQVASDFATASAFLVAGLFEPRQGDQVASSHGNLQKESHR